MSTDSDIKLSLQEWSRLKKVLEETEEELEKHKNKVIEYMKNREINSLVTTNYMVKCSNCSRESIAKKDLPPEIWQRYHKKSSYDTYKLTKTER
jgi:hypothetical protein